MRIEQLQYFAAVTRYGAIRRASDALHITQPALSQAIRNLEDELGVRLLDRHRAGARISRTGLELLPHVTEVLDAVARLRAAADEQNRTRALMRIGSVHAATAPVVAPAIREFRAAFPDTQVELLTAQQADIYTLLRSGGLDLGLVNLLGGDDLEPDLETVELLRGRVAVCCRPDSPLAAQHVVSPDDLFAQPFIAMRAGYLMHRYAHRLLSGPPPTFPYCADGAELGKLMVAEGLGVTLLPDFSVRGDPLERAGAITYRPLLANDADVVLVAQYRRSRRPSASVRVLQAILVAHSRSLDAAAC
ncbi:MAG TPA: LysR family transcriptional regulator [Jatrophihabitans sp.]